MSAAKLDAKDQHALDRTVKELRSNQNFPWLQDELAATENRISVARMRYNDAVRAYNTTAKRFPTNLWASHLRPQRAPVFRGSGIR